MTPNPNPEWTPEPWEVRNVEYGDEVTDDLCIMTGSLMFRDIANVSHVYNGDRVKSSELANANRIVACVNSCAGIVNPAAMRECVEAMDLVREHHVDVDYIEKGTFQGGEEDTDNAEIGYNEECVVISKVVFNRILNALANLKKL